MVTSGDRPVGSGTHFLVLTRYGRMGASSRVRFEEFIDRFKATSGSALTFTLSPLLDDTYLERLYGDGRRSAFYLLRRYAARLRTLMSARSFHGLWIEKELFPGLPAWVEQVLARLSVPMVVDFDDATFLFYESNSNAVIRSLMASKIDAVFRSATIVTAGNQYLANRAVQGGARRVVILPTVVNTVKYSELPPVGEREGRFTIGWIGTPSNARYIGLYAPALACAQIDHGARFMTIGAPPGVADGVEQDARPWSEATEAQLIGTWHAAIAPLEWGPWELGKCAYKVLQCMAAGLPVIAAPVGVVPSIIQHGRNGFLAKDATECRAALDALARDPLLRQRIGDAAQETVYRRYSIDGLSPTLRQTLLESVGTPVGAPVPLPEIPRIAGE